MKSTFLVTIDHGTDTDLLGIASDLTEALEGQFNLTEDVRPWSHPSLQPASPLLGQPPQTPPTVLGT